MAAQAGLCLAWSETPEDTFCRVVAQLFLSGIYALKTGESANISDYGTSAKWEGNKVRINVDMHVPYCQSDFSCLFHLESICCV